MRRLAAATAILALAIGVACGKYGPPVRSVPQKPTATPRATQPARTPPAPGTAVPEERITVPADFDDSPAQEESDQ
jgi:hypothetical protein